MKLSSGMTCSSKLTPLKDTRILIRVEWFNGYDGRGSSSIAESVAIVTSVTFMIINALYSPDSTRRFADRLIVVL